MTTAQLQAELADSKAEIQRLRKRLAVGVHRDLSLISLVPKWSGLDSAIPLEEFFSNIEGSARLGHWEETDKIRAATLRLTDSARTFYNGCPELHDENVTWEQFKKEFRKRFRDVHSDQFHFMKLQTARQGRNESPQQFADRCKTLAQKIMVKTDDPVAQRIHRENMDRMTLASFVAGLSGVPGRQVRYSAPQSMEQALSLAISVQEADKQEKFNESFFARFEDSVRLVSRTKDTYRRDSKSRDSADARAARHTRTQQRPTTSGTRHAQTREALRCYECEGVGHFAAECPTRLRREARPPASPGRRNRRVRSRRSRSPDDKPSRTKEWEIRKETRNQGNE